MKKGEARELGGMFTTLAVIATIGLGLNSVAPELSEITEVQPPAETPTVQTPPESEELTAPALLESAEQLPTILRIYETIDSGEPSGVAPRLPVGVSLGV